MRKFRTRLLYIFELGRPIQGWSIELGRFGNLIFARRVR